MDIEQLLPQDVYDAAVGANSPSASNVFATANDLADYIPLAGTLPLAPITGELVLAESTFPATQAGLVNFTGQSVIKPYQTLYSSFDGQATNPGILTGFAYSFFTGFDVSSFYPAGTPFLIKNTQNGSNDGTHLVTAIHWDGSTNWIQWAGMTTETSAPYGDFATNWEGIEMSATVPDVLGTKESRMFNTPGGTYMTLRKGVYGVPGYYNGSVAILDNFAGDVGGYASYQSYPIKLASQDWIIRQGVTSSVLLAGRQGDMKTSNTAYTEQLAFHNLGGAFGVNSAETLVTALHTNNVDRAVVIQDRDGTLSFIDQIGGQNVNANITAPAVGQDGYVLSWDNGAGEYVLVPDGGVAANFYTADGTISVNRTVTTGANTIAYATGTGSGLIFDPTNGNITAYNPNLGSPSGVLGLSVGPTSQTWDMPTTKSGIVALVSDITGTNSGTNTGDQDSGTTFIISNDLTLRTIDANAINGNNLRDLVCTLIRDLNTAGVLTV